MAGRFDSYTFPPKYIRAARAALILLEFLQLLEDLLDIRFFTDVVYVNVANFAVLIDDEDRALGETSIAKYTIAFGNGAMRIEIGEKREAQATHAGCPRFICVRAVDRNAQDLGVHLAESRELRVKARNLTGSNRGERKRIEHQDDVLSAQVRQFGLRALTIIELEVRRCRPDTQRRGAIGRRFTALRNSHAPLLHCAGRPSFRELAAAGLVDVGTKQNILRLGRQTVEDVLRQIKLDRVRPARPWIRIREF